MCIDGPHSQGAHCLRRGIMRSVVGAEKTRDKLIECGKAQCWGKGGNTQSN